ITHVLEDLEAALFDDNDIQGELYLTSSGEEAPTLSTTHLHASVAAMNSLDSTHIDVEQLCFSAGVESHHKDGLQACVPRIPSAAKHLGIPSTGDLPQLETAYTPRGHITKIHIDGFWDGAILTCLFGSKLLLHWPSTAHNLNILGQQWPLSLRLGLHLISDLEGLKVYHMVHGSHVYLPPGSLHAVIALSTSAMVTFGIKHTNMITSGLKYSEWIFKHLGPQPDSYPNKDLIFEQLQEGANMHCDIDHDIYRAHDLRAHHALHWVLSRS
ncbi:hypothetical protein OC845_006908, partial [Tilletia horrida]